jgi:hypothetical protein
VTLDNWPVLAQLVGCRRGGVMSKKPYEKPQVIYREKIEARAGACSGASTPKGGPPCTAPLVS